ncbi:MAG: hypothetical protein RDV41_09560 [Planctomycetota bacterium]|nr:hypothetical protein [Planctomycetota bacterium]
MNKVLALACLACLVFVGCQSRPTVPPVVEQPRTVDVTEELWASDVGKDGTWFIVTETVPIKDTVRNAGIDAREAARRKAVQMATKEILESPGKYDENVETIDRKILMQPQNYIVSEDVVKAQTFNNGQYYGIKIKVDVDRHKLAKVLQDIGLIRQKLGEKKVIIAVHGKTQMSEELVEDFSRKLGEYFNNAGFEAVLWDEIKTDIAEERNVGEAATEEFIAKFVEDPEFVGDTKDQGSLTLLRNRGRLLIGYNVNKVSVTGTTVNAGVKAFMKDLASGRIVADEQNVGSRIMGRDTDQDLAVSAVLYDIAKECSESLVKKAHDWFDKEEKLDTAKGRTITFIFKGYTAEELVRISKIMRDTFSKGLEIKSFEDTLQAEYRTTERVLDLQEKIRMNLKKNSVTAKEVPPDSAATTVTFEKK